MADKVADMVADMVADVVADMVAKKFTLTSTSTWKSNLRREMVTRVGYWAQFFFTRSLSDLHVF